MKLRSSIATEQAPSTTAEMQFIAVLAMVMRRVYTAMLGRSQGEQITAEGGQLSIHAAKKQEKQEEKGGYVRHERYEGEMTRVVTLPGPIDASKVEATYEHGVLTVRVPKAEGAKPKQIPVKVKEVVGAR